MRTASLAAALLLLAGCDFDPEGRCEVTADCLGGQVCTAGVCVAAEPLPVNHAPVALPDAYVVAASEQFSCPAELGLLANDEDPDGDPLEAERVGPAQTAQGGMAFVQPDGAFIYQPPATPGFSGTDSFTYRAGDGALYSPNTTVTLTVVVAE